MEINVYATIELDALVDAIDPAELVEAIGVAKLVEHMDPDEVLEALDDDDVRDFCAVSWDAPDYVAVLAECNSAMLRAIGEQLGEAADGGRYAQPVEALVALVEGVVRGLRPELPAARIESSVRLLLAPATLGAA